MKKSKTWLIITVLLHITVMTAPVSITAQTLKKINHQISVDGKVTDSEWGELKPFPLTMYSPTYKAAATEISEIKIAYDDKYLYASARFYDSDPSGIRFTTYRRDIINNDDCFWLLITPSKNNVTSGLEFVVTPNGNRVDFEIFNDGNSNNYDWNPYWDAAAEYDNKGWYAEMKVPFSELGLPKFENETEIGIIMGRKISRKNEYLLFPDLSPERSYQSPSRAHSFKFENIQTGNPLFITPYVLGGASKISALNSSSSAFEYNNTWNKDAGLDIKYRPSSNLNLDVTFNTDFAQAEADDQQINLTRFSLFFPEKRQFFQERSGIFLINSANERVFHSRNIGIAQGQIVPIIAGARLVGSVGDWEIGLMNMQAAKKASLNIATENFGVVRLKKRIFNPQSYIGGIITSRINSENSYNAVAGFDADLNISGYNYLSFTAMQSFDSGDKNITGTKFYDNGLYEIKYEKRFLQGWSGYATLTRMGKLYKPELGFTTRQDYTQFTGLLHLNNFPGSDSPFQREMFFHLQGFAAFRNKDMSLESSEWFFYPSAWWKTGENLSLVFYHNYEDLDAPLGFSKDVVVPAGIYNFGRAVVSYSSSQGKPFSFFTSVSYGSFFDGKRTILTFNPSLVVSSYITLSGTYQSNFIKFDSRNQILNTHIFSLKIDAALDTKISLNSLIQYNSLADLVSANIRFRYNFQDGNDLWIVFNHGINTDTESYVPARLPINNQNILVKYTHTLKL